jgi:Cu-Zn family superoxide dismutase
MASKTLVPVLATSAVLAFASMNAWAQHDEKMGPASGVSKAIAVVHHTKGSKVHGTVTFTLTDKGIRVQGKITGLTPGKHGFHIHEFGDTSSPDGMSAGGHFNPHKMEHAAPTATKRHVGDLGNLEANDEGEATYDIVDPALKFSGDASILGRGLVVHEKADDLKTQPTGNAGGRIGVGVIGVAKPN